MSHHASDNRIKHSVRSLLRRPPVALAMLGLPGVVFAGPTGEDVVRGAADVVRPDANGTIVNQHTQRAAINWQTFNVDTDEYVIFNQLNSSSVILNRVIGGDASHILGQIQANGHVFLLNPHGVYFGEGAVLDVQGFLGSTLDMDPDAFMSGDYTLTRNSNSPSTARVINDGQITAGPGGYVVLAGDFTENTGIITAQAGTVALVSGNALTLDIEGDGLVSFAVDEATLSEAAGVRNAGSLIADGGMVVMTAQVASDLVATAVNNEGVVRARSIEESNGEIWLVGHGGNVENHGTLDADGENADGGTIMMYSDRDITLADGAVQTATGDENHEGGFMRFVAEERLDYQRDNVIRATGGVSGGFVEVSGHGSINLMGIPEIGAGGELWIDPQIVAIQSGTAASAPYASSAFTPVFGGCTDALCSGSATVVTTGWIADQLNGGVDVTLVASNTILWNATVAGAINATGTGDLAMHIGTVSSPNGATGLPSTGPGSFGAWTGGPPVITQGTNGDIKIGGLDLNVRGNVTLDALAGQITFNNITTNGNVTISGGQITGNFVGSTGSIVPDSISIAASGFYPADVNVSSYLVAQHNISVTATAFGPTDGNINVGGVWTTNNSVGGNITLSATGGYSGGGNINVALSGSAAGNFLISANGGGGQGNANVTVGGNGPKGLAGATITINANGNYGGTISHAGVVDITGHVVATSGALSITASNTGTGRGGNVEITGAGTSGGVVRGNSVSITANTAGTSIQAGRIHLGNGVPESTYTGALVDATAGNVNLSANGGWSVITTGAITATGDVMLSAIGQQGHIHLGDYVGAIFTGPANVTAGGVVDATVTGTDARFDAGNINAGNRMTITANAQAGGAGMINVGTLAANGVGTGSTGDISLSVLPASAGGSNLIAGNIEVGGITAAQDVTIKVRGASGGFLLDNLSGIANQLTVDTQVGGDVGSANFGGNFNYIGNGTRIDFVGGFVAGGNITVSSTFIGALAGVTVSAGGDIHFTDNETLMSGAHLIAGGQVQIFGSGATFHSVGNITAQHVDLHFTPSGAGNVNVTLGNLSATGTASFNRDVVVAIDGGSGNSTATVNITSATATNGDVALTVFQGATGTPGGVLNVGGINAGALVNLYAPGDIVTTSINGGNQIFVSAGNTVVVNGDISGTGSLHLQAAGTGIGHVDVNGTAISANSISITASGSSGRIDVGTGASPEVSFDGADITAGAGGVSLTATGTNPGGGVINLGSITVTGGGAGINANGGAGGAHVHIGDYAAGVFTAGNITTGASISILANSSGAGTLSAGALVDVGNVSTTTGQIVITANANNGAGAGALNGGNINAGDVLAGGALNMNATGADNGGDISFANASGAGIILNATGANSGGSIIGTGLVTGTGASDDVQLNAMTSGVNGGGIRINGASATRDLYLWTTGGDVSIGTGNLNAGGRVDVNANGGANHALGNVTAAGMHLRFTAAANGAVNVTTGTLTANGTASGNRDIALIVDNGGGSTSNASVNVAGATALNGDIAMLVFNSAFGMQTGTLNVTDAVSAAGNVGLDVRSALTATTINGGTINLRGNTVTTGNLTANGLAASLDETIYVDAIAGASVGAVTAEQIGITATNGNIVTGALTASNSTGNADVYISTNMGGIGGTIMVNGAIDVNGASGAYGQAAGVYLDAGSAGHGITVTGNITVTGAAALFSNTYSNGSIGGAGVSVNAGGGAVSLANVSVSGVGEGWLDINGANVALGSVGMNITNGNLTRNFTYGSTDCGTTCNLTGKEVLTSGGRASVFIGNNSGVTSTATANFTSITVSAGDADVGIENFGNISGGAITVNATGNQFSQSSTGTYAGAAINYSETAIGGGAHLNLMTSAAGTVNLTGAINMAAPGRALLSVAGGTIALSGTTVNVTAGSFARTGQPAPVGYNDGPFDGHMQSGPGIDEGTIVGGMAAIHIGGYTSASMATGTIMANDVTVTGNLAVSAPGSAQINIAGNNISVSGTLTASGGITTQNGTRTYEYVDSVSGDVVVEDSTVVSSYGEAEIGLTGSSLGSVNVGAISVSGPTAGGHVEGGNLTIGGLTVTGTGGNVDVIETSTNQTTGEVTNFEFHGPALLSGFGIEGTGTVTVGGAINITAVGGGGTIISGNSVSLQDVGVTVTDGGYQILDPSVFGASMHSFTLGDAVLDISATTTATAGNVTVNASQVAYHGGSYTATGAINVSAGADMRQLVRNEVQYLNAINDDGGSGSSIALSGPLNAAATSIDINTTTGAVNLASSVLTAAGGMNINAGGNLIVSNTVLNAGTVEINAGGNISNGGTTGSITANGAAISAGGNVNLANTAFTIGSTAAPGAIGDSYLLSLLGGESLAPNSATPNLYVSGNNVTLGNLTFNGDYLYLKADALTFAGTVTTSQADTLVQLAPRLTTSSISVVQNGGGVGTVDYSNTGHLGLFAGRTVAIGTTDHTDDITLSENTANIDIGSTNLFVLTSGTVSGLDKVLSTGVVKDLNALLGLGFNAPQTDEIDVKQDTSETLNSEFELESQPSAEEEEGDEEGEDTSEDTAVDEDDDSLIRQETADEEMMCR